MRTSRFTNQQVATALRRADAGTLVAEICANRLERANLDLDKVARRLQYSPFSSQFCPIHSRRGP